MADRITPSQLFNHFEEKLQRMSSMAGSISPNIFYGNQEYLKKFDSEIASRLNRNRKPFQAHQPTKSCDYIFGPTAFYQRFDKQEDALRAARDRSTVPDPLCTFVYQNEEGYRKFIVAHPIHYWDSYKKLLPENKCSFEVIPEDKPCRLYLDLEFLKEFNPDKDGPQMTRIITDICCQYLTKFFNIARRDIKVLSLDSTNAEKFSRHIIFNTKGAAFKNNIEAGILVKSICSDIMQYLITNKKREQILTYFDREDIESLMVNTKKGKSLFIDNAVYTRNRHFRIYKSTKRGKLSNLEVSPDCKYVPTEIEFSDKDLRIFLDSLVSYFHSRTQLNIMEFNDNSVKSKKFLANHHFGSKPRVQEVKAEKTSQYPKLDQYILSLIKPGKIRQALHFECTKILVYEIFGYRHCENIGRWHKSNNIYLIVDLHKKILYQKCHDTEDCAGFKSEPKFLPEEVKFHLDNETDDLFTQVMEQDDSIEQKENEEA